LHVQTDIATVAGRRPAARLIVAAAGFAHAGHADAGRAAGAAAGLTDRATVAAGSRRRIAARAVGAGRLRRLAARLSGAAADTVAAHADAVTGVARAGVRTVPARASHADIVGAFFVIVAG